MPKLTRSAIPRLRHHKPSGQAYVRLDRRMIYLGPWGTPASQTAYANVIGEWIARGRKPAVEKVELRVCELIDRFWEWAVVYYRDVDGQPTSELGCLQTVLRVWRTHYGESPVNAFGPLALKGIQSRMAAPESENGLGWARGHINRQIGRIRRVLRWGVEHELVEPSVLQGCMAVAPLKRGRSEAKETAPVAPVEVADVDAVLPFLSRPVGAMVRLQLLTGARPGELCGLRAKDVDASGAVWIAAPERHKTAHHGRRREIAIGPKAQEVLRPFLLRSPEAYLFSPMEAERERLAANHERRVTPLSCGNKPGTNRVGKPQRQPGDRYTPASYGRAIARACKQAKVTPWHPHQLRHTAATEARKQFGLEAVQAMLGHANARVTEVYALVDREKAVQVAAAIG